MARIPTTDCNDIMNDVDDKCVADLVLSIDTFLYNTQSTFNDCMFVTNSLCDNGSHFEDKECNDNMNLVSQVPESDEDSQELDFRMVVTQRLVIKHDYHDYSLPGSTENLLTAREKRNLEKLKRKMEKICRSTSSDNSLPEKHWIPFPVALHQLLDDASQYGFDDIVTWQHHGRSFKVVDQKRFVEQTLPRYFKQTKYHSFNRQLALYGFLRLTRMGNDCGSYYHERFLRGYTLLASTIQRKAVKGTRVPYIPSPQTEPHFDTMPPVVVGLCGSSF